MAPGASAIIYQALGFAFLKPKVINVAEFSQPTPTTSTFNKVLCVANQAAHFSDPSKSREGETRTVMDNCPPCRKWQMSSEQGRLVWGHRKWLSGSDPALNCPSPFLLVRLAGSVNQLEPCYSLPETSWFTLTKDLTKFFHILGVCFLAFPFFWMFTCVWTVKSQNLGNEAAEVYTISNRHMQTNNTIRWTFYLVLNVQVCISVSPHQQTRLTTKVAV